MEGEGSCGPAESQVSGRKNVERHGGDGCRIDECIRYHSPVHLKTVKWSIVCCVYFTTGSKKERKKSRHKGQILYDSTHMRS